MLCLANLYKIYKIIYLSLSSFIILPHRGAYRNVLLAVLYYYLWWSAEDEFRSLRNEAALQSGGTAADSSESLVRR